MKIVFIASFILILFGGGLYTVIRYDEYEKKFMISCFALTAIAGILLVVWGVYFHLSATILWSPKGGPVTGAQLLIIGALLSIFSGIQVFKLIKKAKDQK
jgi:hypothetical protein